MSTCIKYSVCDLILTSLFPASEAAIRVKIMHLIKSSLKTRKKENMDIKIFLHTSPSKRSFRHSIHSLLKPEEALTFTVFDAYR